MFPRLKQQLLARADLLVELSTLGEYGVSERGELMELAPAPTPAPLAPRGRSRCDEPHLGGRCASARDRAASARP
jgi:hypothetical protein